ncbi:MAG: hypothetical protein R3C15_20175 [Thermoleophilia bacterium]
MRHLACGAKHTCRSRSSSARRRRRPVRRRRPSSGSAATSSGSCSTCCRASPRRARARPRRLPALRVPALLRRAGTYLTEQYLLQALLCENPRYEVVVALHALVRERPAELAALLPGLDVGREPGPSAFWLRRRG